MYGENLDKETVYGGNLENGNNSTGSGGNNTDGEDTAGEEKQGRHLLRSGRTERAFSREEWILTHIGDENLMEYLELEQKREELLQKTRESRQKRIFSAFQLAVSLAAVVTVIWLLRDNPTVMVNILYIIGIVFAIWIWKNPRSK